MIWQYDNSAWIYLNSCSGLGGAGPLLAELTYAFLPPADGWVWAVWFMMKQWRQKHAKHLETFMIFISLLLPLLIGQSKTQGQTVFKRERNRFPPLLWEKLPSHIIRSQMQVGEEFVAIFASTTSLEQLKIAWSKLVRQI